jgi:pimeloyl-ACP methyl ester carboxylesterase
MNRVQVEFHSEGCRLGGDLLLPDAAGGPWPVVVQGPGWMGLKDAKLYAPYHEALTAAGFAVLVFDYRGFGVSEGSATFLDPAAQVRDIINAVSYATSRDDLDAHRVGVFGSGGTGGGNAVLAGALDRRVKAIVAQVPIADGEDWLKRMRREDEWLAFRERVRADQVVRAQTGAGELVDPRAEIMIPTSERRVTTFKSDVDTRVPREVELASAQAIFEYKPIDHVASIAPRASMFICVEGDATTPEDHTYALYERAGAPKRLVVQSDTTHYGAYAKYAHVVAPLIVDWFERHLVHLGVRVEEDPGRDRGGQVIEVTSAGVGIKEQP